MKTILNRIDDIEKKVMKTNSAELEDRVKKIEIFLSEQFDFVPLRENKSAENYKYLGQVKK